MCREGAGREHIVTPKDRIYTYRNRLQQQKKTPYSHADVPWPSLALPRINDPKRDRSHFHHPYLIRKYSRLRCPCLLQLLKIHIEPSALSLIGHVSKWRCKMRGKTQHIHAPLCILSKPLRPIASPKTRCDMCVSLFPHTPHISTAHTTANE